MSSNRKYIGGRYIPLICGEWDKTEGYEALSVVYYNGRSYTSKQTVPAGIDISNDSYWALSFDYSKLVTTVASTDLDGIAPTMIGQVNVCSDTNAIYMSYGTDEGNWKQISNS